MQIAAYSTWLISQAVVAFLFAFGMLNRGATGIAMIEFWLDIESIRFLCNCSRLPSSQASQMSLLLDGQCSLCMAILQRPFKFEADKPALDGRSKLDDNIITLISDVICASKYTRQFFRGLFGNDRSKHGGTAKNGENLS